MKWPFTRIQTVILGGLASAVFVVFGCGFWIAVYSFISLPTAHLAPVEQSTPLSPAIPPAPTATSTTAESLIPTFPPASTNTPTPVPIDTAMPLPTATPTPSGVTAEVVRVIDGDTIEVAIDGQLYKVRYIGIDTPETVHPSKPVEWMGLEASAKNRELVENKVVQLEKDVSETDQYGRLLRYVWIGDLMVNAELVRLGYAQVSTYPPDVKYQDLFLELQQEAREAGRGLWGAMPTPTPVPTSTPAPTSPPVGQSNVKITYIYYDGQVYRTEADEYVEITNLGGAPQNLAGWRLVDISEGYPSFTFPPCVLQPGASVRVYTNQIHPEWGGFSFGFGKAVWNNKDPDVAALYDAAGNEVSRRSY
jgi:micrococcal nuclease